MIYWFTSLESEIIAVFVVRAGDLKEALVCVSLSMGTNLELSLLSVILHYMYGNGSLT